MVDDDVVTLVLYLVNILQPVEPSFLKKEFDRYPPVQGKHKSQVQTDFDSAIRGLISKKLVMQSKGRYSVTLRGLEGIAELGLSRLRDKNRLFILKKSL